MRRSCLMICVFVLIFMPATGLQASLSDGLVAYYPFNGNAKDESGNGSHGSPVGGATWTTGVLGGAVHLNGSAYINVPDSPSLDLPGGRGTISAFIKVDPSSDGCGIVSKESSSSFASQIAYEYRIGYEGTPQGPLEGFGISDGTTANFVGYTGTPLKYSLWHHVAVTWSGPGGELVMYRDGVQVDQTDQTISTINNISEPVRIGAFRWNVSGIYRYMTGDIDEVRIYDRALSAGEIAELAGIPEPPCTVSDDFEDGIINSNLWVTLGRKGGQGAFGTGGWQHSFTEYPNGEEDGYLEAKVWGPPSGLTYWGEASVRTTYNFNDGNQWLINFTWETTAVSPYFDCFAIQITDGGFPQTESAHWLWNVPPGTVNLWFIVSNGAEDQPIAPFSKRTWSIAIDPAGTASFYQSPNAEGAPYSQVAIDLSQEWYLRLVQVDATSAGYPGGDNTFKLYDFSAVCGPVEPDIDVSPLSHDFGDVELGTSRTVIVIISNVGNGDLNVSGIGLETDFAMTSAPDSAIVVEPSQTEDVEITYTPSAPGYNSSVLKISSNDPDEPVVEVQLIAVGIEIPLPLLEQIANIVAFFDTSVDDGILLGDGPGNSAEKRLNALRNKIEAAGDLIENELFEEACQQLLDAYRRMDGQPKPPDFVNGEAVTELATMIQELMTTLGC